MLARLLALVEPFVAALLATVLLATLLPARGVWADVAGAAADIGIVLLFFLHGARLSREAIVAGMRNGRLHLAVLGTTFVLFPLLGLVFCGSKKSLASGVPMAGVLFPPAQVGVLLLPVMLFHQIQLIACAVIARRYADVGCNRLRTDD